MSANVLIVDDSSLTRAAIRRVIGMLELPIDEIFEAANGIEALACLREQQIDLVLADLNMPEMNGMELVKKMQQDKTLSGIPVIVVSTESSTTRIDGLMDTGIRGYLHKPFQPEDFRNIISQNLGVIS